MEFREVQKVNGEEYKRGVEYFEHSVVVIVDKEGTVDAVTVKVAYAEHERERINIEYCEIEDADHEYSDAEEDKIKEMAESLILGEIEEGVIEE